LLIGLTSFTYFKDRKEGFMVLKPPFARLLVLTALAIGGDVFAGAPKAGVKPQAVIVVETSYPGASALVVADTVGAPIEQQVNGVENSIQLASRCSNDGKYLLAITFKPGTDLDKARKMVQNRIALALPALPEVVKLVGVTARIKMPVRMLVSLTSPGGRFDSLYLSNYATIHVKDELLRVPGVGEVVTFGQRDYAMRVWLDPDKMAARKLSPRDVMNAIRQQNVQVAAGQIGQPPTGKKDPMTLEVIGRLSDPKQFEDIVLRAGGKGGTIKVKDVGRVELGPAVVDSHVSVQGKPGVVLGIHPTAGSKPSDVSRAVADKIKMLRARIPEGLHLEVAFDFTPGLETPGAAKSDEFLLLDLEFPDGTSLVRKQDTLARCEGLLAEIAGVRHTLALTENPFDFIVSQPCVVVRLDPRDKRKTAREEIMRAVRKAVEKIPDAVPRLRDLSRLGEFPRGGYPIELAVSGPEADKVLDLAQKLAERMQKSGKLTDVWTNRESVPRPNLYVDIDRAKAATLGVTVKDILDTLQVHLGPTYVNDFDRFGRSWQVVIQIEPKARPRAEDFEKIKVRTGKGEMVALSSVAAMKSTDGPAAIHRLDMEFMVQVTANSVAGFSPELARPLCERQFELLRKEFRLSAEYRLTWLAELTSRNQ
jgi:multidrug efflux pump subunit AcrB